MIALEVTLAILSAVAVNRAIAGDVLTAVCVGVAWALLFVGVLRVQEKKR